MCSLHPSVRSAPNSQVFSNVPNTVCCSTQLLLYPTAIGSEPQDPTLNSSAHWRRVMQGHAGVSFPTVRAFRGAGALVVCVDGRIVYGGPR